MTREEAMDFVSMAINRTWNEKTCKEILKALEHQTGKWIKIGNTLECPFCGAMGEDIKDDYCFNYCPNCGAKMKGESEQ